MPYQPPFKITAGIISLAIEGNTLSIEQITAILEGRRVIAVH